MQPDPVLSEFLSSHAPNVPGDFFLLWSDRAKGYAICYFDEHEKPMIITVEDELFANDLVGYLRKLGVQSFTSLADAVASKAQ